MNSREVARYSTYDEMGVTFSEGMMKAGVA